MDKVKITTDSTADISPEVIKKYEIETIPLYINLDGNSLKDGIEITPEDIFAFAEKTGRLPKTSSVSVQDYLDLFSAYSHTYNAIIHLNLGSHFSSSYQNAVIAAKEFDNVYVVDSKNLSSGTGLLAIEAAIMAEAGTTTEEIVRSIEALVPKVESSFVIDTLDYLRMGGRCSSVAALSANLLNIKPTIEVIDGAMKVGKKYRGRISKAIEKYVADRLQNRDDLRLDRIFITHTGCSADTVAKVKKLVEESLPFQEIIETEASCTISCHCGPGTLGILFIKK
ncbi:DegV family protein [Bacillaceae bacterium Marseille-Q3522]|nr:DegV family protein [Bacillaceae bacterium Marseille-Q3522]